MARIELIIDGMSCDHCTARVQKALQNADGVTGVTVTPSAFRSEEHTSELQSLS